MLPDEAIKEFQQLYEGHFGERLSETEARSRAERFLQLFRAVYVPPSRVQEDSSRVADLPESKKAGILET